MDFLLRVLTDIKEEHETNSAARGFLRLNGIGWSLSITISKDVFGSVSCNESIFSNFNVFVLSTDLSMTSIISTSESSVSLDTNGNDDNGTTGSTGNDKCANKIKGFLM